MDPDIEIRHLPASDRRKLADILDVDDHWKNLAAILTKKDSSGEHIISSSSMFLLECEKRNLNGSPTRALLDYWGTLGQKHERPRIKDLLKALKIAGLYRAADYVSVKILNGPSVSAVNDHDDDDDDDSDDDDDDDDEVQDDDKNVAYFERDKIDQTVSYNFSLPATAPDLSSLQLIDQQLNTKIINILAKSPQVKQYYLPLIQKLTHNFRNLAINKGGCKIGEGGFGSVYQVRGLESNLLAVKVLKAQFASQFIDELQVISQLNHVNILALKGIAYGHSIMCLLYEYMINGSLAQQLADDSSPTKSAILWNQRIAIASGIAHGIDYIHRNSFTHRDLKSANILLDSNMIPKIGDFGLARLIDCNQTTMLTTIAAGTSPYMPYEAFFGQISPKIDVFSFGIILLELLTGKLATDSFIDSQGDENTILSWIEQVIDDDDDEGKISVILDAKAGNWNVSAAIKLLQIAKKATDEKQNRPTIASIVTLLDKLHSN